MKPEHLIIKQDRFGLKFMFCLFFIARGSIIVFYASHNHCIFYLILYLMFKFYFFL